MNFKIFLIFVSYIFIHTYKKERVGERKRERGREGSALVITHQKHNGLRFIICKVFRNHAKGKFANAFKSC